MTTTTKTLRTASPNGWRIGLVLFTGDEDSVYVVFGPDDEDWSDSDSGSEFLTRPEAEAHFEGEIRRLASVPNYAAQAAYDEANGTDNGYAPWQVGREY